MAGSKIYTSGPIRYANDVIDTLETTSLLSVFTEVSEATLTTGDAMYPAFGSGDLYFVVTNGSYAGGYYINRNDLIGEAAWSNTNASGSVSLDTLHGYQHWVPDNRILVIVDNQSADTHQVAIYYDATRIYNASIGTSYYNPFSGVRDLCANAPGGNPIDIGAVNTGWTIYFTITNTDQVNTSEVTIDMDDYHTPLATPYSKGGSINSGTSWVFNESSAWDYWRVPNILISII